MISPDGPGHDERGRLWPVTLSDQIGVRPITFDHIGERPDLRNILLSQPAMLTKVLHYQLMCSLQMKSPDLSYQMIRCDYSYPVETVARPSGFPKSGEGKFEISAESSAM